MKYQKYEYIVATYPLHHLTDKKIIIFIINDDKIVLTTDLMINGTLFYSVTA